MPSLEAPLRAVLAILRERSLPHRLIGAGALAAHGVSRSTADIDLLTNDTAVLDRKLWVPIAGFELEVTEGPPHDPVRGVVRFDEEITGEIDWDHVPGGVDLVVLQPAWVRDVLASEGPLVQIEGESLMVVADWALVLLKLYAGSRRDQLDVLALLESVEDPAALTFTVSEHVPRLPSRSQRLWETLIT